MYYVIKKPIITEKNSMIAETSNTYAFEVERQATKTEIKSAIENLFDVKVTSVNTSICRNRSKKTRMGSTKVKYWKKAMVKLAKGEKIALFEGAN